MDPATIIGIVLAFVAIFASMILEGGNPMAIFLLPPLLLVFVGTIGAGLAGGLLSDAKKSAAALKDAFMGAPTSADETVATVVRLAESARREGLLALESAVQDIEDAFLRQGLQSAIDGADPEELRDILYAQIDTKRAEDKRAAKFYADMGGYAPTIGIIGTVIGLVHVLENLSEPAELGHLIAGAFVATLWGVLSANILWLPIASRLKRLSESACHQMEVAVEGVLAIQSGTSPRVVQEKLQSFLPPAPAQKEAA
ncbi:flagellar motor protein [Angustibacter luteus]|uniref:Flagellar motor protein n=1 Tax=Angustibacter luteus TaxID=658456 RepID=A0ABW1JHC7_9ACTN